MSPWLRADDPFRNVTDTAGVVCSGFADEPLLEPSPHNAVVAFCEIVDWARPASMIVAIGTLNLGAQSEFLHWESW